MSTRQYPDRARPRRQSTVASAAKTAAEASSQPLGRSRRGLGDALIGTASEGHLQNAPTDRCGSIRGKNATRIVHGPKSERCWASPSRPPNPSTPRRSRHSTTRGGAAAAHFAHAVFRDTHISSEMWELQLPSGRRITPRRRGSATRPRTARLRAARRSILIITTSEVEWPPRPIVWSTSRRSCRRLRVNRALTASCYQRLQTPTAAPRGEALPGLLGRAGHLAGEQHAAVEAGDADVAQYARGVQSAGSGNH